jgi:hypothetical protein
MDLRRIVEEVEERKREEYALLAPPKPRPKPASGSGVTASILEHVRDRMLREDPGADVRAINEVIEPESSTPAPPAPSARLAAEPFVAVVARQAARGTTRAAKGAQTSRKPRDDFLARYLVMSEEFQKRYKVKGWTDLVRKKCSSGLRP